MFYGKTLSMFLILAELMPLPLARLNDTTLITQSTASPEKNGGQAGTLVIWKWLSSDRFRPRTTGTGDIGDILMRGTITVCLIYNIFLTLTSSRTGATVVRSFTLPHSAATSNL